MSSDNFLRRRRGVTYSVAAARRSGCACPVQVERELQLRPLAPAVERRRGRVGLGQEVREGARAVLARRRGVLSSCASSRTARARPHTRPEAPRGALGFGTLLWVFPFRADAHHSEPLEAEASYVAGSPVPLPLPPGPPVIGWTRTKS